MEEKKMGRPTEEKKDHDLKVRVSDRLFRKTKSYAQENDQSIAETLREALEKLLQ